MYFLAHVSNILEKHKADAEILRHPPMILLSPQRGNCVIYMKFIPVEASFPIFWKTIPIFWNRNEFGLLKSMWGYYSNSKSRRYLRRLVFGSSTYYLVRLRRLNPRRLDFILDLKLV